MSSDPFARPSPRAALGEESRGRTTPNFDIVVVGGGVAGCAAALSLRRYSSWSVAVVERTVRADQRIGETIPAATLPLLRYLGLDDDLEAQGHLPAHVSRAAWGQAHLAWHDFTFTGRGNGWHLDRQRFDQSLAEAAECAGAMVLRGRGIRTIARIDDEWRVQTGLGTVTTRYLIDATGRASVVARRVGSRRLRLDRMVAVGARYATNSATFVEHGVLIEATEYGWWYGAPVPSNEIVVAFLSDADLPGTSVREPSRWDAEVARTRHVSALLRGASRTDSPRTWLADSSFLDRVIGDGWVAAGDAAISYDPLSSLGIGHALVSGIQCARIADEALRGGHALASGYPEDVRRHRIDYMKQRSNLYHLEGRFRAAAFWARRTGDSSVDRPTSGLARED